MQLSRKGRAGGFSLIELVVVLVVLGALVAVAAPRYSRSDARQRVDLAMDRIERDILLAEQDAWHTGQSRDIVFDVANNRYEIEGMTDAFGNPYVVELSAVPYRVSLEAADFGGDVRFTLDGRGLDAGTGTIELSAGGVTVDAAVAPRGTDTLSMTLSTTEALVSVVDTDGASPVIK